MPFTNGTGPEHLPIIGGNRRGCLASGTVALGSAHRTGPDYGGIERTRPKSPHGISDF